MEKCVGGEETEIDSAIIQICLVFNSVAYLVNGIFFVLLMRGKINRAFLAITVIVTIFVGVIANYFAGECLPWTPPCMIMLTNFLISAELFLFLNKVKS